MQLKTKFGRFGGIFVPETLIPALEDLERAYIKSKTDKKFQSDLSYYLKHYAGRPTPLYFAKNFSKLVGCKVYLKREDLLHGGAHKTNNVLGQALMAKSMKKTRIIAETGAGQHGIAVAMVGSLFDIPTEIYMGIEDIKRQKPNVLRMEICGAKVIPVEIQQGKGTLKDAVSEALRDWSANIKSTYYMLGSVTGPYPYPSLVRDFQKIIGEESKNQIIQLEGRLPDFILACVGGGSNAMGIFNEFLNDNIKLIGIEAGGTGDKHGAALSKGSEGIFQGNQSFVLQNPEGQILEAHSISAGLDYPGVGPQHAYLKSTKRVKYVSVTDNEAVKAFQILSEKEGIIPALESSHALAYALKIKHQLKPHNIMIINLSGRGDKDIDHVTNYLGRKI